MYDNGPTTHCNVYILKLKSNATLEKLSKLKFCGSRELITVSLHNWL